MSSHSVIDLICIGSSHITSKARAYGDNLKVPRLETRDAGVYSCKQSGKEYTVHVVSGERRQQWLSFLCNLSIFRMIVFFIFTLISLSVFAKPGPVLVQSSEAELHCDITGDPDTEVQWLRPSGQKYSMKKQAIHLKHVTSNEAGQWTCLVNDGLKLSVTLTVVGWCPSVVVIQNECFLYTIMLHISCCQ